MGQNHIENLINHGVCIKAPYGTEALSVDFYRRTVERCIRDGYEAITYEIEVPGAGGEFMLAIWKDGHVDSGSTRSIMDCLAR